jgi:hypothetical protein
MLFMARDIEPLKDCGAELGGAVHPRNCALRDWESALVEPLPVASSF